MLPLVVQLVLGVSVSEVGILREAGARLVEHGTPYPDSAELARLVEERGRLAHTAYNVYLPVLALTGIPSALFGPGPLTDPRLYLITAMFAAFALAGRGRRRTLPILLCTPPVALGLTTGANDLPVLAMLCLGLALLDRGHEVRAGLVTGVAAAMKALAWPAFPVFLAFAVVRYGWRRAARFAGSVVAVLLVAVGIPALVDPHAFVVNVVRMPLELEPVHFEADSPLPGFLLAETGAVGRTISLVLLGSAAIGVLVSLFVRPPATLQAVALRLAIGWLLFMTLAPSTRLGYVVYPLVLALWAGGGGVTSAAVSAWAGSLDRRTRTGS